MITENIKKLEKANLEGKIYAANTLFAENGTFEYQGIYKITEFEEMEGYELTEDLVLPQAIKRENNEFDYYTWINGYVIRLFKNQAEYEINRTLTAENIKTALENTYDARDYLNELVDIALNEF